jgi:hypothetical protein
MNACRLVTYLLVAATIAAAPDSVAGAQSGAPRVYKVGEITLDRYTVMDRIWVESPRSAFWVPTHAGEGAAIDAVLSEAARLGADGVVNLHCLHDDGALPPLAGHFCYANAIKIK